MDEQTPRSTDEGDPDDREDAAATDEPEHADDVAADDAAADDGETAASKPEPGKPDAKAKESRGLALGVLGFLVTLALGFWIGKRLMTEDDGFAVVEEGPRMSVNLRGDEPQLGPDDAIVTIIEFADYECPYCERAAGPLQEAVEEFEGDVRVIYKHLPLPFHKQALPAAKAAWAAHQQGKFWEVHAAMFESGGKLDGLDSLVGRLDLDAERFLADRSGAEAAQSIDDDLKAAAMLGISGTPAFVVNGHHYKGMKTLAQWRTIIAGEREQAQRLVDGGTPRDQIYAALMKDAIVKRAPPPSDDGGPDPGKRYQVLPDDRPALGPDDALVTIVTFSDFQCPFCSKLAPTLHALVEGSDDVRVVFRQLPLQMHEHARPAARAALAAGRQGKFWAMHDHLFDHQREIADAAEDDFEDFAEAIDLDTEQFAKDYADPAIDQAIDADIEVARRFAVNGTPGSFVNGKFVNGAADQGTFEAVIEAERVQARRLVDAGTPPADVLKTLLAGADQRVMRSRKKGS